MAAIRNAVRPSRMEAGIVAVMESTIMLATSRGRCPLGRDRLPRPDMASNRVADFIKAHCRCARNAGSL